MAQLRILKNQGDCRSMQTLSQPNALSKNMWQNTIIVLTFANIAEEMGRFKIDTSDSLPIKVKMQEKFKANFQSTVTAIRKILVESVKLSRIEAESVPIVPAGYKNSPTLPRYDSDILDGKRYHWLSDLWLKALSITKLDAKPAMIKINAHRMVDSIEEYEDRLQSTKTEIAEQMPLIFSAKGKEIGKRLYHRMFGDGASEGAAKGQEYGHCLSYALLVDQSSKNLILTAEEYRELEMEEGFIGILTA